MNIDKLSKMHQSFKLLERKKWKKTSDDIDNGALLPQISGRFSCLV